MTNQSGIEIRVKLRQAIERHGWAIPALGILSISVGVLGGARVSLATQELSQAGVGNAVPTLTPWAYLPYTAKDIPPTPTPTRTPTPVPVEREWLIPDDLPCVALQEASVSPGQTYFKLIRAEWFDYDPPTIFVDVLDENGTRISDQQVKVTNGGTAYIYVKTHGPADFPMFNVLCSYSAEVTGLPSDRVVGMGLGTPEHPDWKIHTHFNLTFQRTTR
jgi:hypothetical protein